MRLEEIRASVEEYKKEQKPRVDELSQKVEQCAENKEFIEFTTGKDCFDYFVKQYITKKDLKTKWRDEAIKVMMREAKKVLKEGGA